MGGIRIIGGRYRGKRLPSPPDRAIRPTADRAREALFNILDHGGMIGGAHVLDLFCGTGAVGLEAFSRGAATVWLIDRDVALVNAAVDAMGRPDGVHVRRADVTAPRATSLGPPPLRFDVAFLDPPYRSGLAGPALDVLGRGWLAADALVVVELAAKETLEPPVAFEVERERRYGAARFVFLRVRKGGEPGSGGQGEAAASS